MLWLAAMCVSPVAGAAVATAGLFPVRAEPVLLAVAAGVLGQAAKVSFGAAFRLAAEHGEPGLASGGIVQAGFARLVLSAPAAATVVAAAITTLAVRGVG